MSNDENFSAHVNKETANMFLGELIGEGIYRKVYANQLNAGLVFKVEERSRSFSNILEWEIWDNVKDTPEGKRWLAPCVAISACGSILMQRRTTPITMKEAPKHVPDWLTDLKIANWGKLDGRIVCHDYSNHLLYNQITRNRTKKAAFFHYDP